MIESNDLLKYGAISFLIATTIGFASVNSETLALIPILRVILLLVSAVSLLIYLGSHRTRQAIFWAIAYFSLFIIYGLLRGLDNLLHIDFLQPLSITYAIVTLGIFFFGACQVHGQQYSIETNFLAFSLALIGFLFLTNGLELEGYPQFNFDLYSNSDSRIMYSQGITKLFSIAVIASILALKREHGLVWTVVLQTLLVIFIVLAFIGGGRGDFLALIIVILTFLFLHSWGKLLLFFFGLSIVYPFAVSFLEVISTDVTAAQRFLVLLEVSDLGSRDFLFEGAVDLLANEPRCLVLGCGFTYFQNYYGYEYGLYPHNLILESFITWGAPLVFISFMLFLYGAWKEAKSNFLNWVGVYFVIVSFKSGDVLVSWWAHIFIFYYVGAGISILVNANVKQKSKLVFK